MWLYRALDRVFPTSLTAKVFVLAFVGTHVPLVAAVVFAILAAPDVAPTQPALIVLLLATAAGAVGTLLGLRALLKPIRIASEAAAAYDAGRTVPSLPRDYRDEAGRLLDVLQRLTERAETTLRDTEAAAERDPLTGLFNRRGFERRIARYVGGSADPASEGVGGDLAALPPIPTPGALLIVDLDRFKDVNDRFGHAVGDTVLVDVATVVRQTIRNTDLVGRFGGEELVVFLPGAGEAGATVRAEAVRTAIASRIATPAGPVTVSIGVAVATDPAEPFVPLFARADAALYEAKAAGRNQVRLAGRDGG